jgi:hypothetical protein
MACCGSEGLFPGEGYCGIPRPGRYTSARVAPIHVSDEDTGKSGRGRIDASLRPNDSTDLEVVESCGSLEGASSISSSQRQPRKRPLAVAVGYGYAEDMNGRPIVVTPNHHRRPSQGNIRASPTFFKSNTHQRDIPSPSLFFTSEHHAQPREKHVSVKPSRVNDS